MSDVNPVSPSPDGELLPPLPERRQLVLNLARNVMDARAAAGLTQLQLAQASELSRATVHLIEAGACDPRISTVAQLARALRLNPLKLLEHHEKC